MTVHPLRNHDGGYLSLCGRSGPLGLLPEQIDPSSGAFLGNYPQAFSHVGLISSGGQPGPDIPGGCTAHH